MAFVSVPVPVPALSVPALSVPRAVCMRATTTAAPRRVHAAPGSSSSVFAGVRFEARRSVRARRPNLWLPAAASAEPAAAEAAPASDAPEIPEEPMVLAEGTEDMAIKISERAMAHLLTLKEKFTEDTCLRFGVRQGGCSGMSYTMDMVKQGETREDDRVYTYPNGFQVIVDPKSLMYLFGMALDYSDALIGGGFDFKNPNATSSCGCGKSFSA
eukprot:tig00021181_g19315.t1